MSVLRCRSASATSQGRRPSNQDRVTTLELPGDRQIVAVADGVGGAAAGEFASTMALEVVARELEAGAELATALRAADAAIRAEVQRDSRRAGMGTTLVMLLRTGGSYQIANVGDNRAYYLDASCMRQITLDHSFMAEAVRIGDLSREETARSPWRNVVTRTLGTQSAVEIDLFGPYDVGTRAHVVLLCSDGLYTALPDAVIHQRLLWAEDAQSAVGTLCALAFLNGSADNITAAVIEFGSFFQSCDLPTMPFDGEARGAARSARPPYGRDPCSCHVAGGNHG